MNFVQCPDRPQVLSAAWVRQAYAAPFAHSYWYRIIHLYKYPFYSIDYAIAEMCAMQLALLDVKDHDACLETYLELCRLGGSLSLNGLVEASGLRSPFDPELIRELMEHARAQIARGRRASPPSPVKSLEAPSPGRRRMGSHFRRRRIESEYQRGKRDRVREESAQ